MPYIVNFTDRDNKTPITVFDNTSNTDTSLIFPGRNVTGYGQIIAENFLSLLENFSNSETNPPVNPTEGQLWYNSTSGVLNIWDNIAWRAASGIQQGVTEPPTETSKVGELWVDTTNQQLRIFSGTRWILVGPNESSIDGLRYGPSIERVADTDNVDRNILVFYIADVPVIVFSKDSFTPKIGISGYSQIKAGINVNVPETSTEISQFVGGFLPKLYGIATEAESLNISGTTVPAGRFLRSDIVNTTEFQFNVRNNNGINIGVDGTFNLSNSTAGAKIYNSSPGSTIDLQTNRNGIPTTVLRVFDNKVAINKSAPDHELDIDGTVALTGSLILSNVTESTNLNNGSFRTAGGASISKNLIVGTTLDVTGVTSVTTLQPKETDTYDSGTGLKRWNTVRAKKIIADEIEGILTGNINGNANTATNLKNVTTFRLNGDVVSPVIQFDGQVGSYTKVFNTSLTANIIASKNNPSPNVSRSEDSILVYRPSIASETSTTATVSAGDFVTGTTYVIASLGTTDFTLIGAASNTIGISFVASGPGTGSGSATTTIVSQGLLRQSRDTFIADLGVPLGTIFPFAGNNVPYGYLLCDGSEVEKSKYPDLFDIIGTTYNRTTFPAGRFIPGFTYTIESLGTVIAGSFVIGRSYTILELGTTNWVSIGAASNTLGVTFVATGVGSGSGVATSTDFTAIGAAANNIGVVFVATGSGVGTGTASTTQLFGVGTYRLPDLRGRFALGRDNMDNLLTVPTSVATYIDAGGGNIDRVPDTKADILGEGAGQSSVTLTLANLPDHTHTMANDAGVQYSAIRIDTAITPPATTGLGPTAPGQAQYFNSTGGIKKPDPSFSLSTPVGTMNPYLTINYIIRSGPPVFTRVE
jgi:microcystin-dependent protein